MTAQLLRVLLFVCFCSMCRLLVGQDTLLVYHDQQLFREVTVSDSLARQIWLKSHLAVLWSDGFLFSGIDSVTQSGAYFHLGEKKDLKIKELIFHDKDDLLESTIKVRKGGASQGASQVLSDYNQNGYPFAQISWDSIAHREAGFSGYLSLSKGPYIVFDSLILNEKIRTNKSFLYQVLEAVPGEPYDERVFTKARARIERFSFLENQTEPQIAFDKGKAFFILNLKERRKNQFEGVVGFLPNQNSDNNLLVTGYINLQLQNLFRAGKYFGFNWNKYSQASQTLDMNYSHPYFLNSNLFLDFKFSLLRQDSTFLTQSWTLGMGKYLGATQQISFGYAAHNGQLISATEENLEEGMADYHTSEYFIGFSDVAYAQAFGLKTGFRYQTNLMIGNKQILRNAAVDDSFYDTLDMKSVLVSATLGTKSQWMISRSNAFYHELNARIYATPQMLQNETSRLGGFKSIRGFNEQLFYAQHYLVNRAEFRSYFEEQSYLLLFFDQGILWDRNRQLQMPSGFGGGLSLSTSNGLFTFVLAMGRSHEIPLDFNSMKVHIGYTSTF